MTATTLHRARPSGLDRVALLLGLALVRAARRHADGRQVTSEEHVRVLDAQRRFEQLSDSKAIRGRPLI